MRRLATEKTVRSPRSGFTIVELMMVVGILLFLIATSAFVVRNIGNKAREKATMATIVKINGLLSQRIQSYQKILESGRSQKLLQQRMNNKRALLVSATGDNEKYLTVSRPVIEILVKKDLFREQFPQFIGDNLSVNAAMGAAAGIEGADGGASISSEYLYYTLTKHDAFGMAPVGEDAFSASEVRDTDGDGLKEFVDGWGRPLRFYRWPTRLFYPYGASGLRRDIAGTLFSGLPPAPSLSNERDPLTVDPDDPLGRIANENTRLGGSLMANLFNHTSNYVYDPNISAMPCEYPVMDIFWMPLIVSAGQDGILALYEPSDFTNNGVLAQPTSLTPDDGIYDNISNHNQRAGGR